MAAAPIPAAAPASASKPCPKGAPVRRYDVVAIAVDITLNRYLDHDPKGLMYVLAGDLPRVRDEEARNAAARAGRDDPAVSLGLQGDAIQPLVLRVHQGECLRISLRDDLPGDQPASLHVHGASLRVAGTNRPAIASEQAAMAHPGQTVEYEWMVGAKEPEGTHYFHSHGDDREQTEHGLFGSLIVERKGTEWLDPRTGTATSTGWDAVIHDPGHRDFREYVLAYHEVGDENYQPLDRKGEFVPLVDPITSAYRPDGRAINYRSEPFMDRLALGQQLTGRVDESIEYSSYGFGDPATPIMRSYLGDPVKERVVHAGSEVFHVHHVHGGAVRWIRDTGVEPSNFDIGLQKRPALRTEISDLTDSQAIGPSETFDIENQCGSGGCQQSAGDFMFHCHVTTHYFAGMWGIWRVYNTLQGGQFSTDSLPPLVELNDRAGMVQPAVPSSALIGRTVDWSGKTFTISDLAAWVERQLPPRGAPHGYDAAVWNWSRDGTTYLGEPETDQAWPAYRSRAPGTRPSILFDPKTGKVAYPLLRPHLGKRPPFAPGHGPAPFLDPSNGPDPPAPGASGPASVCPEGTRPKTFAIEAMNVPIVLSGSANIVDPLGQIYALRQDVDMVKQSPLLQVPLILRANAGEDCIDVTLRSELADSAEEPFSKVSLHIHFMQFDVQGSDGVNTGFNYEQTVRPFRTEGETIAAPSPAGATSVQLGNADRFQPGEVIGVGIDRDKEFEARTVASVDGTTVTFTTPLSFAHAAGEIVSTEFVRYRWYPDVQFGTAFMHDHVNVIFSSRHGLMGAIISEPPGSTYHDPHTGAQIQTGPIADIHTTGRLSPDVSGSFREVVMALQDDVPLTAVGRSGGSAIGLRAEPLDDRGSDHSLVFSSNARGDPSTPLPEAYLGDPVAFRTLVPSNNDVHSWHLDGHWFRIEPQNSRAPPANTVNVGISERFDLFVPAAGGPQRMPGDYLYYNGRSFKLREGSWGIFRVHDAAYTGLQRLPGHESVPAAATSVCPTAAPARSFAVDAVSAPLPMLDGKPGLIYALAGQAPAPGAAPTPLVLHIDVGDCIKVSLHNLTAGPVSFHTDLLAADPATSGGVNAGSNALQTTAPGANRDYTFFASPEVGETVSMVRDWGDVLKNPGLGLYGAIVVGPKGATYRDPVTGKDAGATSAWRVDVHPASGRPYRDMTLFFQDEDAGIGTHRMPYTEVVAGPVGVNYRRAPFQGSLATAISSHPPTPMLDAAAGDSVRLHVLSPWSEQAQVFSVEGHTWARDPGTTGGALIESVQVGPLNALTMNLVAGGPERLAGDYVYGDHRMPFLEAGMWGIFRVGRACTPPDGVQPLSGTCSAGPGRTLRILTGASVLALALLAGWLIVRRRTARTGP